MKFAKITFGIGATILLASCASVHNIPVPTMNNTAVNIPAKKIPLTKKQLKSWPHADLATDTIPGMSLQQAYKFLKGKKWKEVVVGVVDSGNDGIEHEDLKQVIWTNPKEIANNGKDDDKNGFVDDVNGWNFLGKTLNENLEMTRILKKLKPRFEGKTADQIADKDKSDFKLYQKLTAKRVKELKKVDPQIKQVNYLLKVIPLVESYVKKTLHVTTITLKELDSINSSDNPKLMNAKDFLIKVKKNGITKKDLLAEKERLNNKVNYYYNLNYNGRKQGDNPDINTPKIYGNNSIIGDKNVEEHATHVSGIIAAERNNKIGMNGVANHVKIMPVRVVPDGDEYDKDVANGIRYAVDNGAKVINMSFGKAYSPHKNWVFDAIKYAAKHDVLLVHAAGNSAENIDVDNNYPNDSKDKIKEFSDNVITVGAMSSNYNDKLPASFSNYGKLNVDIFAPGVKIYSTIPNNKYAFFNGTSMASPEVAGVAALIRSYYPKLSASQVKHILMNSGTQINFDVLVPGGKGKKEPFKDLSRTGRILNAYNAVRMADQMVHHKG